LNLCHVNKAEPGGSKRLEKILRDSHFLILPAQGECFGVVSCEAASLGVPSLATRIVGVPTAIHEGGNGQLFDNKTFVTECTAFVLEVFSNPKRYRELAIAALSEYESRLNWDASGRRVKELAAQLVGKLP
jgi:glycosyltransferase involved in cell wall biosynthesis